MLCVHPTLADLNLPCDSIVGWKNTEKSRWQTYISFGNKMGDSLLLTREESS